MIRRASLVSAGAMLLWVASSLAYAETGYVPAIKIVLEVRTAQGDLRSFQQPGAQPTYWAQDMPVIQGDRVTITPMIATGGAELGQLRIRLDEQTLADRTEPPWRIEVDPSKLAPGYHLVEVWAATKEPDSAQSSATTTFLVVPENDSILRVLEGGGAAPSPPVSDEERLSCSIRSRDAKVDQEITKTSTAAVSKPTLFYVSAGADAREFFYTLTRDDRVTYTSFRLPLVTHVLLAPKAAKDVGEAAGTVIFSVRAGDGAGRFGPPAWITVRIQQREAGK